jgi:hypothetical protein
MQVVYHRQLPQCTDTLSHWHDRVSLTPLAPLHRSCQDATASSLIVQMAQCKMQQTAHIQTALRRPIVKMPTGCCAALVAPAVWQGNAWQRGSVSVSRTVPPTADRLSRSSLQAGERSIRDREYRWHSWVFWCWCGSPRWLTADQRDFSAHAERHGVAPPSRSASTPIMSRRPPCWRYCDLDRLLAHARDLSFDHHGVFGVSNVHCRCICRSYERVEDSMYG